MNHPVLLAFAVFLLFLIHALLFRIGRSEAPLRSLGRNHVIFGILYLASSFLVEASLWDRLVGLYVFFALQYPFFFVFFGQISRGFSLNLCVSAFLRGGRISEKEILDSYGDGRGVAYVKADRLRVMLESGVAQEVNGKLLLTNRGRIVVLVNRVLLRTLGLDYLGKGRS